MDISEHTTACGAATVALGAHCHVAPARDQLRGVRRRLLCHVRHARRHQHGVHDVGFGRVARPRLHRRLRFGDREQPQRPRGAHRQRAERAVVVLRGLHQLALQPLPSTLRRCHGAVHLYGLCRHREQPRGPTGEGQGLLQGAALAAAAAVLAGGRPGPHQRPRLPRGLVLVNSVGPGHRPQHVRCRVHALRPPMRPGLGAVHDWRA